MHSSKSASDYRCGQALLAQERALISAAFEAAGVGDAAGFREAVCGLHPAEQERFTAVILLAKLAQQLVLLRSPPLASVRANPPAAPYHSLCPGLVSSQTSGHLLWSSLNLGTESNLLTCCVWSSFRTKSA